MRTPAPFDLLLTVESHGWYDLPPWRWDRDQRRLGRPLRLSNGRAVYAEVGEGPRELAFRAIAAGRLSAAEAGEARAAMAACLALDEDLTPFWARIEAVERRGRRRSLPRSERGDWGGLLSPPSKMEALRAAGKAKELPDLRWVLTAGAGRLLRSPTVYEDAVKTLCTTNCTWAVTRGLVTRLCDRLGEPAPLESRTFPTPEAMAARDAPFYREVIRTGYRAPFFAALARGVAEGRVDLEALRRPGNGLEDLDEVAARIRALDGFGPYATEHLLRLLGRHGHLALDSWNRKKLAQLRGKRRPPSDRTLRRWYARYGEWAGLAMWLEVTADWHGAERTWP